MPDPVPVRVNVPHPETEVRTTAVTNPDGKTVEITNPEGTIRDTVIVHGK